MNKSELVDAVASSAGAEKRQVERVLSALIDTVQQAVRGGERVSLPGFGTFSRGDRAARIGRNPQTGAPVKIAAAKVPKFSAGSSFKEFVNGKSSASKRAGTKAAAAKRGAAKKASAKRAPAKKKKEKASAKRAPAKKTTKR